MMQLWFMLMQLQLKLKKNSRNNVFGVKETTNKVPRNIFRGFQVRKKVQLMFWRLKYTIKRKCDSFSCYKERNKVFFLYLECKMQ